MLSRTPDTSTTPFRNTHGPRRWTHAYAGSQRMSPHVRGAEHDSRQTEVSLRARASLSGARAWRARWSTDTRPVREGHQRRKPSRPSSPLPFGVVHRFSRSYSGGLGADGLWKNLKTPQEIRPYAQWQEKEPCESHSALQAVDEETMPASFPTGYAQLKMRQLSPRTRELSSIAGPRGYRRRARLGCR
ncbi:hypothetical protein BD626DRAFT_49994 [Schizophyllum amplum]|uniref:Uncharacterized protein n=1 Tax=Schizophyllum amplum TaxID=97359 RepID=A0A550CCU4_9AGAR|nr:hypothetical protein BD626DRAFT_49994 [Auriculariopsis ampla]